MTQQSLAVGKSFFEALKGGEKDMVLNLVSGELYAKYSRDKVSFVLYDIEVKYGKLKDYTLLETKFSTSIKSGKKEEVIVNTYKTFYSFGFLAEEQLSFTVKSDTKQIEKIDGYQFDSYKPD